MKSPTILSSVPKNHPLNGHYTNFNIGDVSMKSLYVEGESIETNPGENLPILLQFEQPLSPHYFKFCSLFVQEKDKLKDPRVLIFEVNAQLMRAFIAFIFQFEKSIQNLLNGRDTAFFPYKYFDELPNLISVLMQMPPEIFSDFLIEFSEFTRIIQPYLPKIVQCGMSNRITKSIYSIYSIIVDYILSNETNTDEFEYALTYLYEVTYELTTQQPDNSIILNEYTKLTHRLAKTPSYNQFITKEMYSLIFTIMSGILLHIIKTQKELTSQIFECINSILLFIHSLTPILMNELPEQLGNGQFVSTIVDLLEWVIDIELSEDILPVECQRDPLFSKIDIFTNKFEFIDDCRFDIQVYLSEKGKKHDNACAIDPSYIQGMKNVISMLFKMTNICSKDAKFLEYFLIEMNKRVPQKTSLKFLYVSTLILFTATSPEIHKLMHTTNVWRILITDQVVNERTITKDAPEYQVSLCEMVLSLAAASFQSKTDYSTELLYALSGLLKKENPNVFGAIVSLLIQFMSLNYHKFVSNIEKTSILDTILLGFIGYRNLLQTNPEIAIAKVVRSKMAVFIDLFMDKPHGHKSVYEAERRIEMILSLIFEEATYESGMTIISKCAATLQGPIFLRMIANLIRAGFNDAQQPKWIKFYEDVINTITGSSRYNYDNISNFFALTGCLTAFSAIPSAYAEIGDKDLCFKFTDLIIKMVVVLAKKNPEFQNDLSNPANGLHTNLEKCFKFITIEESTVNLLISLATNSDVILSTAARNCHISCVEGLSLLYTAVDGTQFLEPVIEFLREVTKHSISNRYQCFRANIITSLLRLIQENTSPATMELFSQMGASFFRMSELSLTIRLLKSTNAPYALPLLGSLKRMIELFDPMAPPSCLHLGHNSPTFSVPEFTIGRKFTIAMKCFLEAETLQTVQLLPFISISSTIEAQKVNLSIKGSGLYLDIFDGKDNSYLIYDGLTANIWFDLCVVFKGKTITSYIDYTEIMSINLQSSFKFKPEKVTFSIFGAKGNIEDVSIFNSAVSVDSLKNISEWDEKTIVKSMMIARYSAGSTSDGNCINSVPRGIGSALFNGLVVPYTISLVQAIPTCGGPRILLPLFSLAQESEDPQTFLVNLLNLIQLIACQSESIFMDQRFFRSLGNLLFQLPPDYLTKDVVEELYKTYRVLKQSVLKREMLQFVWSNFEIWNRLSIDMQLFIFSGIFTGLLQVDPKTVTTVIPFREFLIRFTSIFTKGKPDKMLLNRSWNFLNMFAQIKFEKDDARMLLASAIFTQTIEIAYASSEIIHSLLTDNNQILISALGDFGYFSPFTQILNGPDEKLRILGLHLLYYIQIKSAALGQISNRFLDLSSEMVNAIRLFQHADQTDMTTHLTMMYIFKDIDHTMKPPFKRQFDFSKKLELVYPEFIPLLISLMQYTSDELKTQCCNYILDSLQNPKGALAFSKCRCWPFWVLYLSLFDSNNGKAWISMLGKIIGAAIRDDPTVDPSHDLYLIEIICRAHGLNFTKIIRSTLSKLFEEDNTANKALADYAIQYLLFVSNDDFEMSRKSPKTGNFQSVIQAFAQSIILMKPDFGESKILSRVTDDDPWSDLMLSKLVAKFILQFPLKTLLGAANGVVENAELNYFTIISYIIRIINKQSAMESDEIIPLIADKLQNTVNNNSVIQGLIVLLDAYSYNCSESEALLNLLHRSDPAYQVASLDTVNDMSDTAIDTIKGQLQTMMDGYSSVRTNLLRAEKAAADDLFQLFFTEAEVDHKMYELRSSYKRAVNDMEINAGRILRGNAKFWKGVMKEMNSQIGGPWYLAEEGGIHYQIDNTLDCIGRRLKMKRNHHFNNHADASQLRDNIESEEDGEQQQQIVAHNPEDNDTDDADNRANTVRIECKMITVGQYYQGTMYIGNKMVAFEAESSTNTVGVFNEKVSKIVEIGIEAISFILKRRYLHIDSAAEIFTNERRSFFFNFASDNARLLFMKKVKEMRPPNMVFIQFKDAIKFYYEMNLQKRWMNGEVSNYEYLHWLNILSGRSIHDMSQYPVFPWVLSDYKSQKLDLYNPESYRDLSKPIGALNPERLENLLFLYNETKDTFCGCMYRFHYSAPAYTVGYMIRNEPFTTMHIDLQTGRFDHPNRLFSSIPAAYSSVTSIHSDFRELTPEFFSTPEFLLNSEHFDLGYFTDKDVRWKVDDVILPPWSNKAAQFVALNRMALESPYASQHLHEWIDLIFGFKQRGNAAISANNVFHPYSYSSIITSEEVKNDRDQLEVIQQHAVNFGVVPDQLFHQPHSKRKFTPPINQLSKGSDVGFDPVHIGRFQELVLGMSVGNKRIQVLYASGEVSTYFRGEILELESQSTIDLPVPSSIANRSTFKRHLVLSLQAKTAVLSTPWNSTFEVFDTSERRAHLEMTDGHSVAITALSFDVFRKEAIIVSASSDSSLIVWDVPKSAQRCRIVAHTTSIVDVAASALCDIVASVDAGGTLVISSLTTGAYIHSLEIGGSPSRVFISSLGFIIVFLDEHSEEMNSTRIVLTDFGARLIDETTITGQCTAACIVEPDDGSSYILAAFETKLCYIFNCIDLNIVQTGPVEDKVAEVAYSREDHDIIMLLERGEILSKRIV